MGFYVYILRCADESFYIGHTDNLEIRIASHQAGSYDGYTKSRRPVSLVFSESFATRDEAFQSERRIKGWSRAKKQALIGGQPVSLRHLALRYARETPRAGLPRRREQIS